MPSPQFQTVRLNEILREAVRVFQVQFVATGRPAIAQRLEFAAADQIEADPELLQRAVQNLILNAIDAMPAGGTLTLRTVSREDAVDLDVIDTGKGLTGEECGRLFTPYYTTKKQGTGLGLVIVQSVVSDHHGSIAVESTPEKGATFHIVLPRRQTTSGRNESVGESMSQNTRDSALAVTQEREDFSDDQGALADRG
jgi:signal transduction histidine kinase